MNARDSEPTRVAPLTGDNELESFEELRTLPADAADDGAPTYATRRAPLTLAGSAPASAPGLSAPSDEEDEPTRSPRESYAFLSDLEEEVVEDPTRVAPPARASHVASSERALPSSESLESSRSSRISRPDLAPRVADSSEVQTSITRGAFSTPSSVPVPSSGARAREESTSLEAHEILSPLALRPRETSPDSVTALAIVPPSRAYDGPMSRKSGIELEQSYPIVGTAPPETLDSSHILSSESDLFPAATALDASELEDLEEDAADHAPRPPQFSAPEPTEVVERAAPMDYVAMRDFFFGDPAAPAGPDAAPGTKRLASPARPATSSRARPRPEAIGNLPLIARPGPATPPSSRPGSRPAVHLATATMAISNDHAPTPPPAPAPSARGSRPDLGVPRPVTSSRASFDATGATAIAPLSLRQQPNGLWTAMPGAPAVLGPPSAPARAPFKLDLPYIIAIVTGLAALAVMFATVLVIRADRKRTDTLQQNSAMSAMTATTDPDPEPALPATDHKPVTQPTSEAKSEAAVTAASAGTPPTMVSPPHRKAIVAPSPRPDPPAPATNVDKDKDKKSKPTSKAGPPKAGKSVEEILEELGEEQLRR